MSTAQTGPAQAVQTHVASAADSVTVTTPAEHVAVVEFARPPLNFFDVELIGVLADRCLAAAEAGARAVVLCSAGSVFCAGADFAAPGSADPEPGPLYEQAVRLFRLPVPVIAAVQGAAVGGGLGLALAADFRVAGERAKFAANFADLGIHPGFGISVTLPRVVGRQLAADLLYTGRRIAAAEAAQIGLVDRLCNQDDVMTCALEMATQIATSAPLAVRAVRDTLRQGLADEVAAAVIHERGEQMKLFKTADFAEGVVAVRERRPGRFVAR